MITSVALRAPTSPPETGASSASTPRAARLLGDLDGQRRLAGRHVDQQRALGQRGQHLVHRLAHVGGVADHGEDDLRGLGDGRRGVAPRRPRRRPAPSARLWVRLKTAQLVAGREQVPGHGRSHQPCSDPTQPPQRDHRMKPFRIEIPDADLVDLRDRLARTRWPDQLAGGWDVGIPVDEVRALADHWRTGYDWRGVGGADQRPRPVPHRDRRRHRPPHPRPQRQRPTRCR